MEEKKVNEPKQIHLPLLIRDLLRNAWVVILAGLIGLMGVFCYGGLLHTPEYTSTVTFAVSPRTNGAYVGLFSSLRTAGEMAEVFNEVFASDVLKRLVKEDMGDPDMEVIVECELQEGTNILKVSTKAEDPLKAHQIMEAVLRNYGTVSQYMFGNVVLDTIKGAHIPTEPSNPIGNIWYALAAVLCMGAAGCGVLFLSLNRATVKTLAGAKYYLGEAPMGVLVREKNAEPGRKRKIKGLLIWKTSVSFRFTEALLQVVHRVRHRMQKEHKKVLLITSVAENEGKSTLASNVAIALAKHGHRVALVDMDLRRPALHKLFSETPLCVDMHQAMEEGFVDDPQRQLFVYALPGGSHNPASLLHDPRMDNFMRQLRENLDFVILDSAPYGAVADTGMLLKYADGCLLSVRQDWVPHKVVRAVAQELDEGGADYMGYVLNYYLDNGSQQKDDKKYKKYE